MTHTKDKAKAATPHHDLIAELLNPNIPKNEREHAAVREIERLQALAAQQEPIGFVVMENPINPQHRPWVGLTDERIAEITVGFYGSAIHHDDYAFARAIEAAFIEENT